MRIQIFLFLTLFCLRVIGSDCKYYNKQYGKIYPDLFNFHKNEVEWNHVERKLKFAGLPYEVNYVSLDQASRSFVGKGFEMLEKTEDLYQSRKKVLAKLGHIVPRLHVKFGETALPDIAELAGGLFGSLIPSNWYHWLEARQFYDARKLLFLDMLLAENSSVEIAYYKIHKEKMEYEIYKSFYDHLNVLVDDLITNQCIKHLDDFAVKYFRGWKAELHKDVFELKREVLKIMPHLVFLMGEDKNWGNTDILEMKLPDERDIKYLNENKIRKRMINHSLELNAIRYFKRAAQYSLAATSTGFFGEDEDEFATFGISFGLDNVAHIQIDKSHIREINIHLRKEKSHLGAIASELVSEHNVLVEDFKSAQYDLKETQDAIHLAINKYITVGDLKVDLHHSVKFLLATTLRINSIKHELLINQSLIDRYLVDSKINSIIDYLPVKKELKRLQKWAKKRKIKVKKDRPLKTLKKKKKTGFKKFTSFFKKKKV